MSPTRRIILNILATYGRSLFSLVLGLFSGRWLLMSLGATDYGLYGLVGGLTAFIAIFNSLLGGAIGRFYALAIGQAQRSLDPARGLQNCQGWFSVAVVIHTITPCFFMVVGYPTGIWLIRNWLTIPPERIADCVWVWRFVCVSCFVGMVNVPFSAMYIAKQYIAELTIYSVVQTLSNFCILAYMVLHPRDWLVTYAWLTCIIAVLPQLIICVRACYAFPECQFVLSARAGTARIRDLLSYCAWQAFGTFSGIVRGQGIAILVNKYFGPRVNAAMALAGTINQHSTSLVTAMQGAFTPAITTAFGAGDMKFVHALSYRACKFGLLLALIFVLPLSIELQEVLRLWLKNPPPYTTGLCWCMLLILLADKSTLGHMIAVNASGKIALYQVILGGVLILSLPLAWIGVSLGYGVYAVVGALVLTMVACSLGRVLMARSRVGLSARHWFVQVILPIVCISLVSVCAGGLPRCYMRPSFVRVMVTTICVEMVFLPLAWRFSLNVAERAFVSNRIPAVLQKLRGVHG